MFTPSTINLPAFGFPQLPIINFAGFPSGIFVTPPVTYPTQPGTQSTNQALQQQAAVFTSLFNQVATNPIAALVLPFTLPFTIALSTQRKTTSGSLTGNNVAIIVPPSGAWQQLQPSPTNVQTGQLYNAFSGVTIGICTGLLGSNPLAPNTSAVTPIGPGQVWNFGPVDLSNYFISNTTNNTSGKVNVYMEL
jgi:hypothetical protein